jgi:succinate dehydrogenase/fumarate reductase cytochrome b subunit
MQTSQRPYLTWEVDIALLNNRFFLYDAGKAFGGAVLLLSVLLLVFAGHGNWESTVALFRLLVICFLFVLVLLVLVVLLVFRNVYRVRYLISEMGIACEAVDRRGRRATTLATVAGLLAGNPGLLGAGLLTAARGASLIEWNRVQKIKAYSASGAITVMNHWRVVVRLFCPRQEFPQALEWLRKQAPAARFVYSQSGPGG